MAIAIRKLNIFLHHFHQLMAKRFREAHETIAIAAQQGLEPDVVNGRIPKPDNYVQHCMRLVEGKLMSYEEIIAETKTMLAGVSDREYVRSIVANVLISRSSVGFRNHRQYRRLHRADVGHASGTAATRLRRTGRRAAAQRFTAAGRARAAFGVHRSLHQGDVAHVSGRAAGVALRRCGCDIR